MIYIFLDFNFNKKMYYIYSCFISVSTFKVVRITTSFAINRFNNLLLKKNIKLK
jgi:hypothetical protein